jgi:probable rRNA maturation factor
VTTGAPTQTGLEVEVGDAQPFLVGLDRAALAAIGRRVLASQGIDRAEVSIAIVDDRAIRVVNRRHLDHDFATDVISFLLSEPGESPLAGEIVVSAETAVRMAGLDGVSPVTELILYVVHGLLHLCGHDDQTPSAAAAMRRLEAERLAAEGLSHPFSPVHPSAGEGGS